MSTHASPIPNIVIPCERCGGVKYCKAKGPGNWPYPGRSKCEHGYAVLTAAEAADVLRGAAKAHIARLPTYMKRAYVRLFGEGR